MRWDPEQYLQFADERGRPFPTCWPGSRRSDPRVVADLGCGARQPHRAARRALAGRRRRGRRRPPEMIAARPGRGRRGVRLELADVRDVGARRGPSTSSSATRPCSGCPDHLAAARPAGRAPRPGGWLAVQVPGNFGEPSHTPAPRAGRRAAVAPSGSAGVRWPARAGAADVPRTARRAGPATWTCGRRPTCRCSTARTPSCAGCAGPGLRPVLSALKDDAERARFEAAYGEHLRKAYPRNAYGTVLPYRRIFLVATRGQG